MKKLSIEELIKEEKKKPYNDIEKVRDVYLKLADYYTYDEWYVYGMDPDYEDIAYRNRIKLEEVDNSENKVAVTCKQIADNLCEVLNLLGIESYNIGYDPSTRNHVATIANVEGKKYVLNLTQDLMCIQKGFKTKYFANESRLEYDDENKYDVLSAEEIKEIDSKLGYCKNGLYMNEVIEMLKKEMNDDNKFKEFLTSQNPSLKNKDIKKELLIMYKLDFIFNYLKNNIEEDKSMEVYEVYKYYRKLIYELFTKEEREKVDVSGYFNFVNAYDAEKDKTLVYQVEIDGEYQHYVYDRKQGHFIKKTKDELEKENIKPYPYQKIQGMER